VEEEKEFIEEEKEDRGFRLIKKNRNKGIRFEP